MKKLKFQILFLLGITVLMLTAGNVKAAESAGPLPEQTLQQIEERLIEALNDYQLVIDISDLQISYDENARQQIFDILYSIPESNYRYFFVDGYSTRYNEIFETVGFSCDPDYTINGTDEPDAAKISADQQTLETAVNKALAAVEPGMSTVEKVLAIHDYIVRICNYDEENFEAGTIPEESYSAWGALVNGKAVCQGYSEAFNMLMNELGIESCVVSSSTISHGWNMVNIDGTWFHVDCTWDDPLIYKGVGIHLDMEDPYDEGYGDHENFLKSDEEFRASGHEGWEADAPAQATVSGRYNGWSFDGTDSLMYYQNGFWYYVDGGKIVSSKIDGSSRREYDVDNVLYLHKLGNQFYYNTPDSVYTFDPATGSQSLWLDVSAAYPGYIMTEFTVKNDQLIGVLYNEQQRNFQHVQLNGNTPEPAPPQSREQVEAFVSRLYTEILGRTPEAEGLSNWSNVLLSGQEQGAKVAQGFIDSNEFKARSLSNTKYLTILYRTFFDREPDGAGLNAWLKVLDDGLSRMHVFKGFAESDEFSRICASYGIVRGNATLTAPMDQNEGVTKFLVRCYRLCLGREADESGLNAWCAQILSGTNTAKQAAYGFVFSNEFKDKNLSDEEFVKTMYRVFMDREADGAGLNAWIEVLRSGQSREHVFNGFADSAEFHGICASYGIS